MFIALLCVYFKSAHTGYRAGEKKSYNSAMILGLGAGVSGFLFQSLFDYTFYNYRVMAVFFMVIAMTVALSHIVRESGNEE